MAPRSKNVATARNLPRWVIVLIAAVIAAGLCGFVGLMLRTFYPWGCATRAGIDVYAWTCLLPGNLFTAAPVAVAVLAAASAGSQKIFDWMKRHPLVLTVLTGAIVHAATAFIFGVLVESGRRYGLLWDILSLPQPFVAGASAACVFAFALRGLQAPR